MACPTTLAGLKDISEGFASLTRTDTLSEDHIKAFETWFGYLEKKLKQPAVKEAPAMESHFYNVMLPDFLSHVLKKGNYKSSSFIQAVQGFLLRLPGRLVPKFSSTATGVPYEGIFTVLKELLDPNQPFYSKYGFPSHVGAHSAIELAIAAEFSVSNQGEFYVDCQLVGGGEWKTAVVIEVDMDSRTQAKRAKVQSCDGDDWSLWINLDGSVPLAPCGTGVSWRQNLRSGDLIDAKHPNGHWYQAVILDTSVQSLVGDTNVDLLMETSFDNNECDAVNFNEDLVMMSSSSCSPSLGHINDFQAKQSFAWVSFLGFPEKDDAWIALDSDRLSSFNEKSRGCRGPGPVRRTISEMVNHISVSKELESIANACVLRHSCFHAPSYVAVANTLAGLNGFHELTSFIGAPGRDPSECLKVIVILGNAAAVFSDALLLNVSDCITKWLDALVDDNSVLLTVEKSLLQSALEALKKLGKRVIADANPIAAMKRIEIFELDLGVGLFCSTVEERRTVGLELLSGLICRGENSRKECFRPEILRRKIKPDSTARKTISEPDFLLLFADVPSLKYLTLNSISARLSTPIILEFIVNIKDLQGNQIVWILNLFRLFDLSNESQRSLDLYDALWKAACNDVRQVKQVYLALLECFPYGSGFDVMLLQQITAMPPDVVTDMILDLLVGIANRTRAIIFDANLNDTSHPSLQAHLRCLSVIQGYSLDTSNVRAPIAIHARSSIQVVLGIGLQLSTQAELDSVPKNFPWHTHWIRAIGIVQVALADLGCFTAIPQNLNLVMAFITSWPQLPVAASLVQINDDSIALPTLQSNDHGVSFICRGVVVKFFEETANPLSSLIIACIEHLTLQASASQNSEHPDSRLQYQGIQQSLFDGLKTIFEASANLGFEMPYEYFARLWDIVIREGHKQSEIDRLLKFMCDMCRPVAKLSSTSRLNTHQLCSHETMSRLLTELICGRDKFFIYSPFYTDSGQDCLERIFSLISESKGLLRIDESETIYLLKSFREFSDWSLFFDVALNCQAFAIAEKATNYLCMLSRRVALDHDVERLKLENQALILDRCMRELENTQSTNTQRQRRILRVLVDILGAHLSDKSCDPLLDSTHLAILESKNYYDILFSLLSLSTESDSDICEMLWVVLIRLPSSSFIRCAWLESLGEGDSDATSLLKVLCCDGDSGTVNVCKLFYNLKIIDSLLHCVEDTTDSSSTWSQKFAINGGYEALSYALEALSLTANRAVTDSITSSRLHINGCSLAILLAAIQLSANLLQSASFEIMGNSVTTIGESSISLVKKSVLTAHGKVIALTSAKANKNPLVQVFKFPTDVCTSLLENSSLVFLTQNVIFSLFSSIRYFCRDCYLDFKEGETPSLATNLKLSRSFAALRDLFAVWLSHLSWNPAAVELLWGDWSSVHATPENVVDLPQFVRQAILGTFPDSSNAEMLQSGFTDSMMSDWFITSIDLTVDFLSKTAEEQYRSITLRETLLRSMLDNRPTLLVTTGNSSSNDSFAPMLAYTSKLVHWKTNPPELRILSSDKRRDICLSIFEDLQLAVSSRESDLRLQYLEAILLLLNALCQSRKKVLRALYGYPVNRNILVFLLENCLGHSLPPTLAPTPLCKTTASRNAAYAVIKSFCEWQESVLVETMLYFQVNHQSVVLSDRHQFDPFVHENFPGLHNLGNTCYMNCILQLLFYNTEIREYFLEYPAEGDERSDLVTELHRLFRNLMNSTEAVSPKAWFAAYGAQLGTQEDAALSLGSVYSKLQECLKERLQSTDTDGLPKPQPDIFENSIGSVLLNRDVNMLNGHTKESMEQSIYHIISVSGVATLEEGLSKLVQRTIIPNYQWESASVNAARKSCFASLSNNLVFCLRRLLFDAKRGGYKLNDRFEFPDTLDMRPYSRDGQLSIVDPSRGDDYYQYRLKACVVHSGDYSGGHYWSYIKVPVANHSQGYRWFEFNDARVQDFHENSIPRQCFGGNSGGPSAYMIVYERVNPITKRARELFTYDRNSIKKNIDCSRIETADIDQADVDKAINDVQLEKRIISVPHLSFLCSALVLLRRFYTSVPTGGEYAILVRDYYGFIIGTACSETLRLFAKYNDSTVVRMLMDELITCIPLQHDVITESDVSESDDFTPAPWPRPRPDILLSEDDLLAKAILLSQQDEPPASPGRGSLPVISYPPVSIFLIYGGLHIFPSQVEKSGSLKLRVFSDQQASKDISNPSLVLMNEDFDNIVVRNLFAFDEDIRAKCSAIIFGLFNDYFNGSTFSPEKVENLWFPDVSTTAAGNKEETRENIDITSVTSPTLGKVSKTIMLRKELLLKLTDILTLQELSVHWRRADGFLKLLLNLIKSQPLIKRLCSTRQLVGHLIDIFLGEASPFAGVRYARESRQFAPSSNCFVYPISETGQLNAHASKIPDWTILLEIIAEMSISQFVETWTTFDIEALNVTDFYSSCMKQTRYSRQVALIIQSLCKVAFLSGQKNDLDQVLVGQRIFGNIIVAKAVGPALANATFESTMPIFCAIDNLLSSDEPFIELFKSQTHTSVLLYVLDFMKSRGKSKLFCVCIRSLIWIWKRKLSVIPSLKQLLLEPLFQIIWQNLLMAAVQFRVKQATYSMISSTIPAPYLIVHGEAPHEAHLTWFERALLTEKELKAFVSELGLNPFELTPADAEQLRDEDLSFSDIGYPSWSGW